MHDYDESVRSDKSKDRAHRRKKHREEIRNDSGVDNSKTHRSHRRRKKTESGEREDPNLPEEDSTRIGVEQYQADEIEACQEPSESNAEEGKTRKQGSRRSKRRHHNGNHSEREPDYVNTGFGRPHEQHRRNNTTQDYPYGVEEETEEYVEEHTGYVPSVDENYPEQVGSILSDSQVPNGSVSYHPEYDVRSPRHYSRSASQLDPSAQSVSDYGGQSIHSANPRTVGGDKPGFWNLDDERYNPMFPTVPTNTEIEPTVTRPTALQKFLASFRRLKPRTHSGALHVDPQTADKSGSSTARVILLDGEELSYQLDRNDVGLALFTRVCETVDLVETDYFGLTYVSNKLRTWFWLDMDRKISKQLRNGEQWIFSFQVRFYPPEPTLLQEDITRYLLTLQVRQDIYTGKLPCSWVTQALLGSFMVQAELGDYDEREYGGSTAYLHEFEFVPSPTPQLLQKISELHKTHVGMKPNQADIKYLETAKRLELYGVDLHPVRDMENVDIYLGVGFHGIVIYRDRLRIGRFAWPKVLRISYKKNNFYLKIRPDNTEPVEAVIGFRLLNHYLANRLWKAAVEHHAFFRLKEARSPKGPSTPLNLTHTYTGRTFFQYRTMNINRPHPHFDRSLMKRRTASMPTGLNKTGSMHTLNRAHPRDMTVGRTQDSDNFGAKRSGSAHMSLAPVTHAGSTGQLYNTVPRNVGSYHDRSQMGQLIGEGEDRSMSYLSSGHGSSVNNSQPHEYLNYSKRSYGWQEDAGSAVSGSVVSESTARGSTINSRQPDRRNGRRPLSPVYINAPGRSGASETPSELDQASSTWRTSDQSSGRKHPPRGGAMLHSHNARASQPTTTSVPRSKHRSEQPPEDLDFPPLADETGNQDNYPSEESHSDGRRRYGKHRQPKSSPSHYPRRHQESTELML